jgi:hypothetical protein
MSKLSVSMPAQFPFLADAAPIVPAYHVRSAPANIAYHCPWCEKVHMHGALGGDGGRGSHCEDKTSLLFGKQIDLLFAGTVANYNAVPKLTACEFVSLSCRLTRARMGAS